MENKKVLLHIRGMQFDVSRSGEEESGVIETVTTGVLRRIGAHSASHGEREIDRDGDCGFDGCYEIKYEEIQEDFDQTSDVLLKASPGHLEMTRKGLLNVRMEFSDGRFTQSEYSTPFGDILFGFQTRRVTVTEQEDGVWICASYMMEMNGEYLADSEIEIYAEYVGRKYT